MSANVRAWHPACDCYDAVLSEALFGSCFWKADHSSRQRYCYSAHGHHIWSCDNLIWLGIYPSSWLFSDERQKNCLILWQLARCTDPSQLTSYGKVGLELPRWKKLQSEKETTINPCFMSLERGMCVFIVSWIWLQHDALAEQAVICWFTAVLLGIFCKLL